jgi:hypothetical protein
MHGEARQRTALAAAIQAQCGLAATLPKQGDVIEG